MRFDADTLRPFLGWILPRHAALGGLTELRALGRGPRGGVWSAFVGPDDLDAVVTALAPLPGSPRPVIPDWPRSGEANVYFSLNPVDPGTAPSRGKGLFARVRRTTRDRDVLAYSLLAIDVDPERSPPGRAASDAEKAEARAVATAIRAELLEAGVTPLWADSGNGYHLLVPLVPSDREGVVAASREARSVLRALDGRFSTRGARVDVSTFNPSRILKLYGTLAMKGEPTEEHPHRLSRIDVSSVPVDTDVVTRLAARAGYFVRTQGEPAAPPAPPPAARAVPPPATGPATAWSLWRREVLARVPLEAVYGELLTGKTTNGWRQCRDPRSPSGDATPSAGVADGASEAARGSFHSFRDGRTLSVFDFLIERGTCGDFRAACAHLAALSGVPMPSGAAVGQGAVERLDGAWGEADEEARNGAVRDTLAAAMHLPAIELRAVMEATAERTGLSMSLLHRTLGELRKAERRETVRARASAPPPRGRAVVDFVQNRDTIEALFDALVGAVRPFCRFFRQGRDLVFVRRGVGPILIHERNIAGLLSALVELRFLQEHDDGQELVRYDVLPTDLCRAFVHSPRVAAALPELVGYSRTPLFDAASRLIATPGFDPDSGIFSDGPAVEPGEGTGHLDRALGGFHWLTEVDRVNVIGALLTTLTMPMWTRGHPFVAINGNKAGVGKSTLARLIALLAEGGDEVSTVSWCPDDGEFEKQLATRVECGDRVIIVDNARTARAIESAVLERCITDTRLSFRRLGTNTAISRPRNDVMFCLTMNIVQLGRDLRRRALPVNLSTEVDVRDLIYPLDDVLGWVQEHRVALVGELVGLVQRWLDAGQPLAEEPARHSTSQRWAATIDGILAHAGLPGFLSNFSASEHAFDPKYEVMAEIVRAHRDEPSRTPGEWAGLLGEVMEERFRDRSGAERTDRAKATIVGALFSEYADTVFEVDGEAWRLVKELPEGVGRAVWRVGRVGVG